MTKGIYLVTVGRLITTAPSMSHHCACKWGCRVGAQSSGKLPGNSRVGLLESTKCCTKRTKVLGVTKLLGRSQIRVEHTVRVQAWNGQRIVIVVLILVVCCLVRIV